MLIRLMHSQLSQKFLAELINRPYDIRRITEESKDTKGAPAVQPTFRVVFKPNGKLGRFL